MKTVETSDVTKFEQRMIEEVRKWMEQRERQEKTLELALSSFLQTKN